MFKFFRKKKNSKNTPAAPSPTPEQTSSPAPAPAPTTTQTTQQITPQTTAPAALPAASVAAPPPTPDKAGDTAADNATADSPSAAAPRRTGWLGKLKSRLQRTGSSISSVFTGTKIDDALYEELEDALLLSDAGVAATEYLLNDLKQRVKSSKATDTAQVRSLLADAFTDLLQPLERELVIGQHPTTVMMIAGVNGAGKTTTIGKLTRHFSNAGLHTLLAAADTFRAAAREQLAVWADRNQVEIISQEGADPAAVSFDAVSAGKARGKDVVMIDTAGRLPTQLNLMEEIRKIKRVINKADAGAPHETLLVIDGNTGQNALTQVKAFDDALQLTGLIITKLDGTAKGGVLAAIALWAREQAQQHKRHIAVYFIGVGEQLDDLQTFSAQEFSQAILGAENQATTA